MPYLNVLKFSVSLLVLKILLFYPWGWCTFKALQLELGGLSASIQEAQVLVKV